MAIDRWEFVRQFRRMQEEDWYRLEVDGEHYCDLAFSPEESFQSILDVCTCLVESDKRYTGTQVNSSYFGQEQKLICLYIRACTEEDWWLL